MEKLYQKSEVGECVIGIGYTYYPSEVEIDSIELLEGSLVDLLYEVGTSKTWWIDLEDKLMEREE